MHAARKFDTIVGLLDLTIATSGFVDTTSYAAYADFSYDFTDKLSASLGGRYTADEKEGARPTGRTSRACIRRCSATMRRCPA